VNGLPWLTAAAPCLRYDPTLWDDENADDTAVAKRICATCPLITDCLQHALDNDEHGIWGGSNEKERRAMQHRAAHRTRPAVCGTDSGYYRHLRTLLEPACPDCLEAHRTVSRTRARARRAA
jgi:hypothetical protein